MASPSTVAQLNLKMLNSEDDGNFFDKQSNAIN